MVVTLLDIQAWIFDLDGTLTVPQHDFAAIKRRLGLPVDQPVLEGVARLDEERRRAVLAAIDAWEIELADQAQPNPGARELLEQLAQAGLPMGVLTRNTRATAYRTLRAAGLDTFFPPEAVLGRDEAPPKPAPDGIHQLVALFGKPPARAVMVGDYRFDLEAGRAAGARTVWLDAERTGTFRPLADLVVHSLLDIMVHLSPTAGTPPGATG
jgi:HAD superfamily hydrolase (TIGR01509 family)